MLKISLAELIGNAFALHLDQTGSRNLNLTHIKDFGHAVIQDLEKQNISAQLLSIEEIDEVVKEFPEWFSFDKSTNTVILNEQISVDDLFNKFSGDMIPYTMHAFADAENLKILLA